MKTKLRTCSLIGLPLLFSLLLGACEPTDWDVILAPPEPVTGLSVTGHTGNDITFNFTLPAFSEQVALFPDYTIMVYYCSRPAAGGEETYLDYTFYEPSDYGTQQTEDLIFPGLTSGTDYVFILYTVDNEYQKSAPAETSTITW